MKKKIRTASFSKAKSWPGAIYLDDDLILIDHAGRMLLPAEPRVMNFLMIGLCTKGGIKYLVDTQEKELTAGGLLVASEHHLIEGIEATPDFDGLTMMISVPFFHEIINDITDLSALFLFSRLHPVISLSQRDQNTFVEYFKLIHSKVSTTDNPFRKNLTRALIQAMFYDLSSLVYRNQQVTTRRHTRGDIIFAQFIKMVEANCRRERRVRWYAAQLDITPKYLSELIKSTSLRSPNEWIDNYVTREVRVMLKNTTKSIKEISAELNFPNQSFFGKYFREQTGMSPSQYRRS